MRNYGLLAFLAGLVAVRYPYPGVLALGLILVLGVIQGKKTVHALFFCLCFGAALLYGQSRSPVPPPEPLWLLEAMGGDDSHQRPHVLYVEGEVAKTDVYADGRIRLILKRVAPAPPPSLLEEHYGRLPHGLVASLENAEPYEGRMAVTLWQSGGVPLPGQTVAFSGRFARVRGFANTGVFTIDDYWHDRGVWIRGWNIRGKYATTVDIQGEPHFFAGIRNTLWRDFVMALPAAGTQEQERQNLPRPENVPAFQSIQGIQGIQGTGQAFLPALIFGDRSGITPYQKDLLSRATLTHSIALSGLHLAYVGLIGIGLAIAASKVWPNLVLVVPRPKLCFITTVPLALFYLWIGGTPLSLVRSALMLFFFGLILFGNRAKVLIDGLFAAVFLIALVWPWALFDLSLQLSALSVGVIALLHPLVSRCVFALVPVSSEQTLGLYAKDRVRAALTLLLMSFCIQTALAPLLVKTFGAVGLWFPLNLVWLPVLGAIVMPLAFLAFFCVCCGWMGLAELLLSGASLPCEGLMWLLQWMDGAGYLAAPLVLRPHWLVVAGAWLFLGLLPLAVWHGWRFVRHKEGDGRSFGFAVAGCVASVLLVAGLTTLAYYRYERQDVSLSMLDVGHGQALVLSWPGGRALVDGGGFPSGTFDVGQMVVAPYLTAEKPAKVDWLINSHPDYDHLGGMLHIFEGFTVTRGFAHNGDAIHNTLAERYKRIAFNKPHVPLSVWRAGDYIPLWHERGNELGLEVLWPPAKMPPAKMPPEKMPPAVHEASRLVNGKGMLAAREGFKKSGRTSVVAREEKDVAYTGNDASLVLRLVWRGEGLALICGDIGKKALRHFLEITPPEALRAEVLVLPHHGSKSSYSKTLYETVDPDTVLVSCAYKNSWGFPNKTIVETLSAMGKPLYSTASHGMVKVVWPKEHNRGRVEVAR